MTSPPDSRPTPRKRRILFLAEAVTLAHVARPFALACALDPEAYEVYLACDPRYRHLFPASTFTWRPLSSISVERFLDALAKGQRLYDVPTLHGYVEEDLKLLQELRPDAVVGDFRLSLAVSARVSGTPYLAITNAYWSPYARQCFPLPDLPLVRQVGLRAARLLFGLIRPFAFAYHTRPLNRVRRAYGLPSLDLDLRRVYTEADYTLYADVPELTPVYNAPPSHQFLGPVLWSPAVPPPPWWDEVPLDRLVIYVTLGSSGRPELLGVVLEALADLPVWVVAATAGHPLPEAVPANAFVANYLPGEAAAAQAALVVCNGGSPTTQQALAAGKPVVGLPSNMDQYLNMGSVWRVGAGELVQAGQATAGQVQTTVREVLSQPRYAAAAAGLAGTLAKYDARARFREIVDRVGDERRARRRRV
jgi:UDP:flavonoid glycosyltransferase YjiC (YdhE family)